MAVEITTSNAQIVKLIKSTLQAHKLLDKSLKIRKTGQLFHILSSVPLAETTELLKDYIDEISLTPVEVAAALDDSLYGVVSRYLKENLGSTSSADLTALLSKLPKKWALYPPMVLLSTGSFDSEPWERAFESHLNKDDFFASIIRTFAGNVTHVAVNKPIIEQDVMRRPFNLVPIWGDFGPAPSLELFSNPSTSDLQQAFWCTALQNGIHQTWAPRYTMFSRGNIKEKKRILDTVGQLGTDNVLDLYAGIGYFTLSYLAKGATLFCWEINPWSIEGLVRGLRQNGHLFHLIPRNATLTASELQGLVSRGVKAFVFHESNEFAPERLAKLCISDVAHVNLGLLPSLKPSWAMASEAITNSAKKTIIHVHENIHKDSFQELTQEVEDYFRGRVNHLEKVKTFAPDVWHVVLDVEVVRV